MSTHFGTTQTFRIVSTFNGSCSSPSLRIQSTPVQIYLYVQETSSVIFLEAILCSMNSHYSVDSIWAVSNIRGMILQLQRVVGDKLKKYAEINAT